MTILMLSLGFGLANAQTDSTETGKKDSNDVEIVITPKKDQDSTIVKVGGMKIIVLNDKSSDKVIIDGESTEADSNDNDDKEDNVSHWAGIRIGVNGYLNNNALPLEAGDQYLELDYGRSLSWDLNLLEKDFKLYKQHIELVTGLGFHFANYSFNSEYATLINTTPFSYSVDSTRLLTKNKLKATYITAPLMLGFSTHKDENKAFRFAFGGQASYRLGSKLKQQYSDGGNTQTLKYKDDYDLNPFLLHAIASVGYGPMSLFASYGLNPLFKSSKTVGNVVPFDMGVQLMF